MTNTERLLSDIVEKLDGIEMELSGLPEHLSLILAALKAPSGQSSRASSAKRDKAPPPEKKVATARHLRPGLKPLGAKIRARAKT